MKEIDADYYGYRDEDDGRLLPLEKEAEENGKQFWLCLVVNLKTLVLVINFYTVLAQL